MSHPSLTDQRVALLPSLERETETRLRAAYQVVRFVQQVEDSAPVRAWFMGLNHQHDDESPAEAICDGGARDAMTAARAFVDDGQCLQPGEQ